MMVEVALKHHVKIPRLYVDDQALLTIESIGKQLDPNLNAIEEARPMVTRILPRTVESSADGVSIAHHFQKSGADFY